MRKQKTAFEAFFLFFSLGAPDKGGIIVCFLLKICYPATHGHKKNTLSWWRFVLASI